LMVLVTYPMLYPSVPLKRTRKYEHGVPAQFTSVIETKADG